MHGAPTNRLETDGSDNGGRRMAESEWDGRTLHTVAPHVTNSQASSRSQSQVTAKRQTIAESFSTL